MKFWRNRPTEMVDIAEPTQDEWRPLTGIEKHWIEVEAERIDAEQARRRQRIEEVKKQIAELRTSIAPVLAQIAALENEIRPNAYYYELMQGNALNMFYPGQMLSGLLGQSASGGQP